MRIWIVALGSKARDTYDQIAGIYLDRLAAYVPSSGGRSGLETLQFRSEKVFWDAVNLEHQRTAPLVVLLDEAGRNMASAAFARWLGRQRSEGRQLLIFATGPADGWSEASRARAGMLLSLGPMTLPHELARVVLCEQVYRAFTILAGHPYHRS